MIGGRLTIVAGLGLGVLAIDHPAAAYCRTSVCDQGMPHTAAVCDPPTPDDCGTALAWTPSCAEFSVQQDGSPKLGITAAELTTIMTTAFLTWDEAACPSGGKPSMLVTAGPEAVCASPEYNQNAANANVIMFHDDSWPYEGTSNTLALTTVTYDLDTGEIYDADMELNSADNHFTTSDTDVDFDLPSIVTHESGHFQGMAHSHDPAATMWPGYNEHTTTLRDLSPDDVAGICAAYPPAPAASCDPTPRGGFSALCADGQPTPTTTSSCAAASGAARPLDGAAAFAALAGLILTSRGRRRRRTAG